MTASSTSLRDRFALALGLALLSWALLAGASALTPPGALPAFDPLYGVLFVAFIRTPRARWLEWTLAVLVGVTVFALLNPERALTRSPHHLAGDAIAACLAALALQRGLAGGLSLGRLRDVVAFVVVATIGPMLSALGTSILARSSDAALALTFRSVWSAESLGVFAVAPTLLTLSDGALRPIAATRAKQVEFAGLFAAIVAVTYATYHASTPFPLPRGFPALLLMWTAFRFGPRGSAIGMALMTTTVLWAVASGRMAAIPSLGVNPSAALWELQGFLSLSFVTVLVLAALGEERAVLIDRLEGEVRVLRGLLPICAHCKKIRDDANHWHPLESFLQRHTEATFTHGICPSCMTTHYGEILDRGN